MVDTSRRSALDGHYETGNFGSEGPEGPGVSLSERRPSAMAQVNGAPDEARLAELLSTLAPDAAPKPLSSFQAEGLRMLWTGPGQWFAMSDSMAPAVLVSTLEDVLAGTDATVTDLSHARTVLRISGPACKDLLTKGCPADVEAMAPGDCLLSLLSHFNVLVDCVAEDACEVYVFRSFGLSLWEWLTDAAGEFGYCVQSVDVA